MRHSSGRHCNFKLPAQVPEHPGVVERVPGPGTQVRHRSRRRRRCSVLRGSGPPGQSCLSLGLCLDDRQPYARRVSWPTERPRCQIACRCHCIAKRGTFPIILRVVLRALDPGLRDASRNTDVLWDWAPQGGVRSAGDAFASDMAPIGDLEPGVPGGSMQTNACSTAAEGSSQLQTSATRRCYGFGERCGG
jgi:hypothetical protein